MSRLTEALYSAYHRLARWILPGHKHPQQVYGESLSQLLRPGVAWLDLGCGHQILPAWLNADEAGMIAGCGLIVGIDLHLPSLQTNRIIPNRVLGPTESLPFRADTFDLVSANMVVEHLGDPAAVLKEVKRVLRPGGRFVFHTPNRHAPIIRVAAHTPEAPKKLLIRLFEGRSEEDVFETRYQMNTEEQVRLKASAAGLTVERFSPLNSGALTAVLGPLAIPELLFLRMLRSERLRNLRSNFIVVLTK